MKRCCVLAGFAILLLSPCVFAKQKKLKKGEVRQIAQVMLSLSESLETQNEQMLSNIVDPKSGVFFWNTQNTGCVVPVHVVMPKKEKAETLVENNGESFVDAGYEEESQLLSEAVAVLGNEKEEWKVDCAKPESELPLLPSASVEVKKAQQHLFSYLQKASQCLHEEKKLAQSEKAWLKQQFMVEVRILRGHDGMSVFFRKVGGEFYVFHLMKFNACTGSASEVKL